MLRLIVTWKEMRRSATCKRVVDIHITGVLRALHSCLQIHYCCVYTHTHIYIYTYNASLLVNFWKMYNFSAFVFVHLPCNIHATIVLIEVIDLNMCIITYTHTQTHTHDNIRARGFTSFDVLAFRYMPWNLLICLALMSKAVWLLPEGQRDWMIVTFCYNFHIVWLQKSDTLSYFR